jgi:hypothetical protein
MRVASSRACSTVSLESWRISSYPALKPAPAAIPTATADKQHDDNDDQKSCRVHSVLRKSPNQRPPQGSSGCIAARAHVWARSRKAFLLSSVLAA